ncbi:MAG: hypothetical protein E6G40_13430, partial [Actinobacteria bacterium]
MEVGGAELRERDGVGKVREFHGEGEVGVHPPEPSVCRRPARGSTKPQPDGHHAPGRRGLHPRTPPPPRRTGAARDGGRGQRARLPHRRPHGRRRPGDAGPGHRGQTGHRARFRVRVFGLLVLRSGGPGWRDPENEKKARDYLERAGLWDPVEFHVGDAVKTMNSLKGEFDIVYCDIDKHGYPEAWRAARDRIRVGGLYICDNT